VLSRLTALLLTPLLLPPSDADILRRSPTDHVQAAGIDVQPSTAWTILAPTNFAFTDRLNKTFGITPADLLLPESVETLTAVSLKNIGT
jgi:hypothetical protein